MIHKTKASESVLRGLVCKIFGFDGEIKELRGEQRRHAEEMSNRLTNLEKWKWTIVGGAVVIGFFLSGGIDAISRFMS